jgi:hypothetical protein
MSESFVVEVEYTDTFGGEPNYCWVRREEFTLPHNLTNRAIMRRCKAAMGLTGQRGRSYSDGDSWEFRPAHSCTVMFARVKY